jgi:hypothetical protein
MRTRLWIGGLSMEWSRRLVNWIAKAINLALPGAEERDLQTGSEGSRKATWPDVFFLIEKLEKHRAEYVLIGGSKA